MKKPNIVEFIWHDLGQHLGCYGGRSVKSPELDRFASEGALLENMFCTAPACTPSRSSIMTGCYPHSNGLMGLAHKGWNYNEGQKTLTHVLRENGYRTLLARHQHEAAEEEGFEKKLGYDKVLPVETHMKSAELAPHICGFIDEELDGSDPFFLSVGFFDVHRPNYGGVSREDIDNVILPPYVPDNEGTRRDMAQYEKMIEASDRAVGDILGTLYRKGFGENTIFLFTTDHGSEFNRAKMTLYDPGIKVACLMKYKGCIKEGLKLKGMRSNIDLMPTLLDLAGIPIPDFVQGESFRTALEGGEHPGREYIIAEKTHHGYYDPMRCIRTEKYKYIWNTDPGRPMQISERHSERMGTELAGRLYNMKRSEHELYDLEKDPGETDNLVGKCEYEDILENLREKLLSVLKQTNDPLLEGKLPEI